DNDYANFLSLHLILQTSHSFVKSVRNDHIADSELLEKFYTDKDQVWLGILLERYTLLLYGVCMKYLKDEHAAKDCVQQIFLKALTEIPKYKIEYFKSWLYMVAKNHCLMRLRGQSDKITKEVNEQSLLVANENKDELLENEQTYEKLEEAIDELNEEQRQCIVLFYLKKNSYQQIAEKTGYSLMQIKSYIQNGKRNLKMILEKKIKGRNRS
ncbi:MAG TPA: sigma-70 family RNA polymerase sigma factor, partial [Flavisolibacter sp.]|nr:sigma-70 family RNA polymerase sigma factor [Flavisolibacter sp.]